MPKVPRTSGAVGLALTAWDVWRRLSPRQRKAIIDQARRYGPALADQALRSARAAREHLKKP